LKTCRHGGDASFADLGLLWFLIFLAMLPELPRVRMGRWLPRFRDRKSFSSLPE
jgi:hypothetical protein